MDREFHRVDKDLWCTRFIFKTSESLITSSGDVIYIQLPKQPMLILNSLSDADNMLNKRAGVYSGRPDIFMVNALYALDPSSFMFLTKG